MVERTSSRTTHPQSADGPRAPRCHHQPQRSDTRPNQIQQLTVERSIAASSGHRFSLFGWLRRRNSISSVAPETRRPRHKLFRGRTKRRSSTSSSSSSSSVNTSYSTATVKSFAFHVPVHCVGDSGNVNILLERQDPSDRTVGPFAPGAIKLVENRRRYGASSSASNTCTLPSAFLHRQDIQTRYSLLPVNTSSFISFDSIPVVDSRPRVFALQTRVNREESIGTSDSSLSSAVRRVHVRGKRRAPEPPLKQIINIHVAAGSSGGVNITSKPAARGRRKRRPAPKPPGISETGLSSNRDTLSSETSTGMDTLKSDRDHQTISNDTLVLRRGVLLAKKHLDSPTKFDSKTPVTSTCDSDVDKIVNDNPTTPITNVQELGTLILRPWYKRNVLVEQPTLSRDPLTNSRKGGSDFLRRLPPLTDTEREDANKTLILATSPPSTSFPFEGSLSRLNFFQRSDRHQNDDKKKESKRKSGVSILTNISELDREAAAIVQQEQARNRASMILQAAKMDEDFERRMRANEKIIQEIVNSSLESSPRKSTKALISKFNALGNLTKSSVNNNFFSKSNNSSPKTKPKRFSQDCSSNGFRGCKEGQLNGRSHQYPSSQESYPNKDSASIFSEIIIPGKPTITTAHAKPTTNHIPCSTAASASRGSNDTNTIFEKALVSELDDVAIGIAKLRRELDDRPRMIEEAMTNQAKANENDEKETPIVVNKLRTSKEKEFVNFDREFNKIFGEINRQLQRNNLGVNQTQDRNEKIPTPPERVTSLSSTITIADKIDSPKKNTALNSQLSATAIESSTNELKSILDQEKRNKNGLKVNDALSTSESEYSVRKKLVDKDSKTHKQIGDGKIHEAVIKPSTSVQFTQDEKPLRKISTKVSSGVQTNGNVRRVVGEPGPHVRLKENNVLPQANRSTGDTHQLIKADESEAVTHKKLVEQFPENTYTNVMERSLYANAKVAPVASCKVAPDRHGQSYSSSSRAKIDLRAKDSGLASASSPLVCAARNNDSETTYGTAGGDYEDEKEKYLNTMAVNRLLRKLEAAIAAGNHQQAARLARELAQLKIHCSVVRQRSHGTKLLRLNLYIEDRQAHQGPIPLRLPMNMSVAQLKAKVQIEFDIPANVQRWIIGKNLVHNDELTLDELQALNDSPVFLYLITAKDTKEKPKVEDDQKSLDLNSDGLEEPKQNEDCGDAQETHAIEAKIQRAIDNHDEEIVAEANIDCGPPEVQENPLSQEEKLQRYEELISLENCDVISTTEPFECPVCFMIYGPDEGIILRDCLHTFCRSCVANVVRYCEEAEVKCPYRDAEYTCESTLQEREIKALVPAEVYQQHLAKSITQAENSAGKNAFHCKTPDCAGWCIYDDDVNNFFCPVCKANNCLTCQAIHTGRNCRQYQEELKFPKDADHESRRTAAMLEEMVEKGEALPCPTCAVVLMKKWGCDWLRCSMCKTEICWVTRGPRWGSAGKGDISGGCKCGENGVKCHPKCNYCH
ncbi:hypothetical protein QAD02_022367 [Eretmocerus hayati]|uniref:Uncharacterized protein n=1 Tax=Eretmocerus hayati TaxID=131215 RepID=A0ACC2PSV7_9HYME|nr:hypothetical protein QAD02_022367 [Eretmocerus hayati]